MPHIRQGLSDWDVSHKARVSSTRQLGIILLSGRKSKNGKTAAWGAIVTAAPYREEWKLD